MYNEYEKELLLVLAKNLTTILSYNKNAINYITDMNKVVKENYLIDGQEVSGLLKVRDNLNNISRDINDLLLDIKKDIG